MLDTMPAIAPTLGAVVQTAMKRRTASMRRMLTVIRDPCAACSMLPSTMGWKLFR
jgi:hypothetical protein